jgi:hypothetical protein
MKKIITIVALVFAGAMAFGAPPAQPTAMVHPAIAATHAPHLNAALGAGAGSVSGSAISLTWKAGSACGATINGSAITCKANVYQCIGACAYPAATGQTWSQIATGITESGAYTVAAPPTAGALSYLVTDLATGNGWNGTSTGIATGSESGASNIATLTFQPPSPTGLAAQ